MNSVFLIKYFFNLRVTGNQSFYLGKHNITRISSNVDNDKEKNAIKYIKPNQNKHFNKKREYFKINDKDISSSQFLNSKQHNPDDFGTLSDDWQTQQRLKDLPEEKGDIIETEFLNNIEGKKRLTTNQYARIIKKFLSQKKISHAIEVLETRMKEDRAPPESYIYNLLIGACGEVGYTKKAFNLYKQMRVRGLKVTGHTYTGLFNSLANSPFPEESLQRAHHLRAKLQEKGVVMNRLIYHAMIKAYGRCGDLETAFLLVDEMLEKKIVVTNETFNFLLQACITDKSAGFRHALMVWWKMRQKRIWPDLFTFNLLLRCCRDCGLGDETATQQAIQLILQSNRVSQKVLGADEVSKANQLEIGTSRSEESPNLICRHPTMGNIVAVKNISKPEHRLVLMGGSRGVLEQMSFYNVTPDIKTFAHLLDQIPHTLTDEQELLTAMKHLKVKIDLDFYNMLIRKRCIRGDFSSAKEVLKMIQAENFRPNIVTFGVLALTSRTLSSAQQLVQDIHNVGFRPNVEILGALLKNACYSRDCDFIMGIMKMIKEEEIQPSKMLLNHLNNFYRFATDVLSKQDTDDTGKLKRDRFEAYLKYFHSWRPEMRAEEAPHPWKQYKEYTSEPDDIELLNKGRMKYAP